MRTIRHSIIAIFLPVAGAFISSYYTAVNAFAPLSQRPPRAASSTLAGFLDDVGNFFNGLGNEYNEQTTSESLVEEIDGVYTGSKRIVTIPGEFASHYCAHAYTTWCDHWALYSPLSYPASSKHKANSMKLGGLRLYCNLYLMGLQNTPEPNSWKASQSDNSEVNLRYCDLSGSIIIQFTDDGITVDRLGSSPSMKYLTAESMIVNGFLDELHAIVYDGDVVNEDRLLTLAEPDAIEKAREFVSFS